MRTATLGALCLPILLAGCASRSTSTAAKPATPATASKPAAATGQASPASPAAPARTAGGDAADAGGDDAGSARAERREMPDLRPYDRVITKDAKSDAGVFTVHRIRDRIYYEIPKELLGREFLWVSQIASTTAGAGFGGQAAGNRVVRWERRDRRVLLRSVSYDIVADPGAADRAGGQRRQLRHDPDGVPDRDDEQAGRAGDRRHAAVHHRGAGVQRPRPAARPRLRFEPRLRRARQGVPDQRRGPGHSHLHHAERAARRRWRSRAGARPEPCAAGATRQLQRADVRTAWCCSPRSRCSRGCTTIASASSR